MYNLEALEEAYCMKYIIIHITHPEEEKICGCTYSPVSA